jgi:hypothetical protein
MNPRKKKKMTALELAVGSGLLAVFLPVILFAAVWAVIGTGLAALYVFVLQGNTAAFWPMRLNQQ